MTDELLVDNGDIRLRVEVTGEGPTILCVHGWPETAHSWGHQVDHFSRRGFHVAAAMDVRGYGGSSVPVEVERYTLRELAGDVAAVATALDDGPIVLFGHDWGAPISWNAAIRHPELVRAVAGLSVPHTPQLPMSLLDLFDQLYADRFFYMLYFQEPGVAEVDFGVDLAAALKRVFYALSGESPPGSFIPDAPRDAKLLPLLPDPPTGPMGFMSDDDLDSYVRAIASTGMVGAFNRYRAMALDADASADIVGATVDRPACFIGGELDPVRSIIPGADSYADPGAGCTDYRGTTIVDGAGHWVHQEAPDRVNAALEAFLSTI